MEYGWFPALSYEIMAVRILQKLDLFADAGLPGCANDWRRAFTKVNEERNLGRFTES
jgi:hypothetical protein